MKALIRKIRKAIREDKRCYIFVSAGFQLLLIITAGRLGMVGTDADALFALVVILLNILLICVRIYLSIREGRVYLHKNRSAKVNPESR